MALRDINLIAADILERRCLLRHLFLWCGGIAAVVVLTLAVYAYETRLLYAARQNLGGNNLQATLAAAATEMSREQQALNLARREQAQISSHSAAQRSYALVLAKLVGIMNDQTWLQQLTLEAGKERTVRLKLLGQSLSHAYLGNFIQTLSADPLFRGVVLKYSQEAEAQTSGANPVQFHIECDIVGG